MRRVVILWRNLPHYRIQFYEQLRGVLRDSGVTLELLVGQPSEADLARRDQASLGWEKRLDTRRIHLGESELLWQPAGGLVRASDLVIAEQGSKNLTNYWLHALRRAGAIRLAYWGHGVNLQARPEDIGRRFSEALKWRLTREVDWWFAYTKRTADLVAASGFPRERITDVQNSIDTRRLRLDLEVVSEQDCAALRQRLGLPGKHVGLFMGGLYPDKNLPFLIAAADEIRARVPGFHLCVAGDGVDAAIVQAAAGTRPWMHWVGAVFGREKAIQLRVSSVLMVPQVAGLVILDGFVAAVPVVTIKGALHPPEVAYLETGLNALVTERGSSPSVYAEAVAALLLDPARLARLRAGCIASSNAYTIENMVNRFSTGILQALNVDGPAGHGERRGQ